MNDQDLNLLKTFAFLLEERHISRVAARLHVTQPAISRALARLRIEFNDPLFVRTPKGMLPTAKALALEKPLFELLERVTAFYKAPTAFDPATAKGLIRIATTDYFEQVIWVDLVGALNRQAPGLKFVTLMTGSEFPMDAMRDGTVHLAIAGFFGDLPNGFMRQALFSDHFLSVLRKDHPSAKRSLTLEKFLKLSHLVVSPRGDHSGVVDFELQKRGKQRHVAASVCSFLSSGPLVAQSNFVLTAPAKLVERFTTYLPLKAMPPPISLPKINVVQVWHERFHNDAMLSWVRKMIFEACKAMT
ncbi:MAG: LysR family transcriptional regulator [Proteobacteria bacterium]|nr:LysR family transcriptional regulator [Pseudomonadota bacterium]